jgi:hypothetical protein
MNTPAIIFDTLDRVAASLDERKAASLATEVDAVLYAIRAINSTKMKVGSRLVAALDDTAAAIDAADPQLAAEIDTMVSKLLSAVNVYKKQC